ncbi:MAG: CRISPR-associated endonuclease Cas1, partial [Hydrogenophilus sp.]|nr:CRISPR-associated endonuclease Cas1 [Hydrogenophilus sp.]
GHCTLSTPLIEACVRHNIPLMLAIPGQTPVIILGQEGEARRYRRLALHHTALAKLDEAMRARLAARIVEAKLRGYAVVVRQRYQAGDHVLLANLERAMKSLAQTERLAIVRGWEGWFARQYHRWLGRHTHELADFTQRRHRGEARDPINAMLNYGYALLRQRVGVAVRLAGLDPYLGVLHEANGRHEALVSDIMEPYRRGSAPWRRGSGEAFTAPGVCLPKGGARRQACAVASSQCVCSWRASG